MCHINKAAQPWRSLLTKEARCGKVALSLTFLPLQLNPWLLGKLAKCHRYSASAPADLRQPQLANICWSWLLLKWMSQDELVPSEEVGGWRIERRKTEKWDMCTDHNSFLSKAIVSVWLWQCKASQSGAQLERTNSTGLMVKHPAHHLLLSASLGVAEGLL